jgi:transcriptional regulator with XRE-family HTH domain
VIPIEELAAEVRKKRGGRGLKALEEETGVSASTLSRVERGHVPDTQTLKKLARWLGVNIQAAGAGEIGIESDEDLERAVAVYLRAKKDLPEEAAASIAEAVQHVMEYRLEEYRQKKGRK